MSETDDTDILLLIPPNFFSVESSASDDSLLESSRTVVQKPPSCTVQVIGKLVSQVHSLESRIESLELSTVSDSVSTRDIHSSLTSLLKYKKDAFSDKINSSFDNYENLDCKSFTFPRRRKRKTFGRERRSNFKSSQTSIESSSAHERAIPLLCLTNSLSKNSFSTLEQVNDSVSMDGDISSIVSSPSKRTDRLLLHEIDEFLSKVECYESPESRIKSETTDCPENVIRATGEYISQRLSQQNTVNEVTLPSGRSVPSDLLDKYIYLVKNGNQPHHTHSERTTNIPNLYNVPQVTPANSHNVTPIKVEPIDNGNPDLNRCTSARKLSFPDNNRNVQPTSTPKRPQATNADNFRPSTNKVYHRASRVMEQYKLNTLSNVDTSVTNTSYFASPKKDEFKGYKGKGYDASQKPSVSGFCSSANQLGVRYPDSVDTELLSLSELWGDQRQKLDSGKLEEERLKREHCEAIIQELQKKILEQQEKLAVAMRVDRAKDNAIAKLREAWLRVTHSLDSAETRHKASLDKMLMEIADFKARADEAQKKTHHFEAELYKTLDLAHDYQEKCKKMDLEKEELQLSTEKALQERQEILNGKDSEIASLRENYEAVMRLNKQSTDCIKKLESELEKEQSDHFATKTRVQEMNKKTITFNEEMSVLKQDRDLIKDKIKEERSRVLVLEKQYEETHARLRDSQKREEYLDSELKNIRKHLELQKNELKTYYQKQLEDAVLAKLTEFQQQLDAAEKEMEKDARSKENAIVDTFNKQMQRIEEQHKLEIAVLEEKQKEEIKLYRLQLAQTGDKISTLESKLEAYRQRRGQIASQLHSVMESQWRQALQILTSSHTPANSSAVLADNAPTPTTVDNRGTNKQSLPSFMDVGSGSRNNVSQFEQLRGSATGQPEKQSSCDGLSDSDLQHYVKLLLTKSPDFLNGSGDSGLTANEGTGPSAYRQNHDEVLEEPTSDRPEHSSKDKTKERTSKRYLNMSKPPWKA